MNSTVKKWWIGFSIVLLLTLVAEFFIHPHALFTMEQTSQIEASRFFHAWYGFAACAVIVIFSKLVGYLLKVAENYYDEEH